MQTTRRSALRWLLGLLALFSTALTADARPLPTVSPPAVEASQWPPIWFWDSNPGAGLKRDAVGLWRFENSANLGLDSSSNANNLTNTNSVTQAAGQVGQAGNFVAANSQYLSIASNSTLATGDIPFTVAAWVRLAGAVQNQQIAGKGWDTANQREWVLRTNGAQFVFDVSSNGTATTSRTAATFGTPAATTWYFVVAWHDSVADTLNIQINNGPVDSTSYSSGVFAGTDIFGIGHAGTGSGSYWNGRIDEMLVIKRVLTASEKAWLYNGGSGHAFSQVRPAWDDLVVTLRRLGRAA